MTANDMSLKEYVKERLDKVDKALDDHRTETNSRFEKLATKEDLEKAIGGSDDRIAWWTRVIMVFGAFFSASIGALWKVVWDSIPHKFTNP